MSHDEILKSSIDALWESLPSTWLKIRSQIGGVAIKGHGLSLLQFHILNHVCMGFRTAAKLADHLQVSRPAVSQALEGLTSRKLIARETCPKDRRVVYLELTADGKALLAESAEKSRSWMAEQMASLTDKELETLIEAMKLLEQSYISPKEPSAT